jgi:hypothetical protein
MRLPTSVASTNSRLGPFILFIVLLLKGSAAGWWRASALLESSRRSVVRDRAIFARHADPLYLTVSNRTGLAH